MVESGQTTKNKPKGVIGTIARAALIARGQLPPERENLDIFAHEGPVPRISEEDQADLRLFFNEENAGDGGGWARSNFDVMTDRLSLYAQQPRPCLHCGGVKQVVQKVEKLIDGEMRPIEEVVVEEQKGSGLETESARFKEWLRIEKICRRPHGPKEVEAWLYRNNEAFRWELDGDKWRKVKLGHGDIFCQKCEGWGWKFPKVTKAKEITVDFTGQAVRYMPRKMIGGNEDLERLGRTGRRVAKVQTDDVISQAVLACEFSPDGGQPHVLWHLTPTGQQLLEGNLLDRPHQAFFKTLREVQKTNKDPSQDRRFDRANREARQLLDRAFRVWAKAVAYG
jgi:hypothetical protein